MLKILGLLGALLAVVATLAGGTWAYFNDTEATANNVVTAGILDLTLAGASANTAAFIDAVGYNNLVPGSTGADSTLLANTAGTIAGNLSVNLGNVSQIAGAIGEFATGTDLGTNLYMAIWLDKDNGGTWGANDVGLKNAANTTYTVVAGGSYTADAGSTATAIVDAALVQADDYWNGFKVTITSGTYSGLVGVVTDFVADDDKLIVTEFPGAIATGVTYDLSGPLYYTMASYDDLGAYSNILTMAKSPDAGYQWDFNAEWLIPASVGNTIQGDSATFDSISFTLAQIP